MRITFFIFILLVLLSAVAYVVVRGIQSLAPSPLLRTVYWVAMALMCAMLLMTFFSPFHLSPFAAKNISFVGYSFLIVVMYLFLAFLLIDFVRILNHFAHFIDNVAAFRYWATCISIGLIILLMTIGNYRFNHPKTVRLNVSVANKSQNNTVKIVAVSDLHLGVSIDKKRLQRYVAMINAEKPDMVLIAGDLIDRSIKPVEEQKMEEELRQIEASLGVYAVLGNHEYYGEGKMRVKDFYRKTNITLLNDSSVLIHNDFYVVGRDDATNRHRKTLAEILSELERTKPTILLDHQPHNLHDAEKHAIDLQISGHTHNGQIFPGNLLVKRIYETGYGYARKGDTHYYVSSGLGIWGPQYRIGTQSEMVVINFRY